ncbi:carboxylic acid reductase [Mycolicibacterium sp. 050232]|uniref:carboxylic acid reductase n=1 Tax=Mycolicibacterium sp. 050232 TaxID=3113982 RepID=UPI002E2E4EE5|nr:carboxylic acid reductase [Mycolicibacterium sp. 050232]MED5816290.1 carboxylic acid reductase [Mycolicibacterium sp. 050232]
MPDTRTVCGRPLRPDLTAEMAGRAAELYAADRQFRSALPLPEVSAAVRQDGLGLAGIIAAVMAGYPDRPALGRCTGSALHTISYRDLWQRINAIAADWRTHQQFSISPGDFVCTVGFASTDYMTLDLACALTGAVTVPVQYGAPPAQLARVLAETRASVLAVGSDQLPNAVEAACTHPGLRRLIVFDHQPDSVVAREAFEKARLWMAGRPVLVESLDEVIRRGRRLCHAPWPRPPLPPADPDRLVGLSYTSGSTGPPKAAMYTERMVAGTWRNSVAIPVISYNYMPMSHYGGKALVLTTLASGGTAYFAGAPDMSTLFDDIALVRPTVLPLIPRVSELIYSRYQREYGRRSTPGSAPATVRKKVMTDLRENVLGGRLLLAASGSAPLSAELTSFIESCLQVHLAIGYGTTETGNVLNDGRVVRPPVIDYKLVDVPELGYFSTDRPHPRGELLVKSEILSPGYYHREDATDTAFDAAGYYRTGDIMAEIGPDHLTFVDRRSNVVKLSQGEFVALSQLESVFVASPYVRQIFVYGSSRHAFVLAVVVPEHSPGQPAATRATILGSLQTIARDNGLRPYEIPRDILIESRPFSIDNGLLTPTAKPARPALTACYRDQLENAYAAILDRQSAELAAVRRSAADSPALDTVLRATTATLGIDGIDADTVLSDTGADSLAALALANLLSEIFDVPVPAAAVIEPTRSLTGIASLIEAQRRAARRPDCAGVHIAGTDLVPAGDLTLDRFIGQCGFAGDRHVAPDCGPPGTVLLTGANGFLGQPLCAQLLRRLAPAGGRVICLIRGGDNAEARHRLRAELGRTTENRLEVLAGDLTDEHLGLNGATWSHLAATVDLIVHAGALVNHLLPYPELFGPNVVGTAGLIRLAITGKSKRFAFVSTAAAGTTDDGRALPEDADVRVGCPARTRTAAPANGYVISKWAGEVLLREAHDSHGLSVQVFRPGMILAHSRFSDHLNIGDVFTRLLLSLAATGIAPRSFYREPAGRPHYDGLPVDFVAAAIAALAAGPEPAGGFATYNVVNDHDDAISLDVVVDWLNAAGHPITRIDSHRAWAARFETAMRALPTRQRRHCLLPLMAAFAQPAEAVAGSAFPARRFRDGLEAMDAPFPVPHLTPDVVHGYLGALRRRDLL